jgi:homoaconitase/3-isopropylmalate dehydratase large subunit
MNKELFAYVETKETVDREELVQLFGDRYAVPSYEMLSERYIAGKIAQDLSAARDEEHRRLILAARYKEGIKYVFISSCKNSRMLQKIKLRIAADIHGQEVSLNKVNTQLKGLDGDTEDA